MVKLITVSPSGTLQETDVPDVGGLTGQAVLIVSDDARVRYEEAFIEAQPGEGLGDFTEEELIYRVPELLPVPVDVSAVGYAVDEEFPAFREESTIAVLLDIEELFPQPIDVVGLQIIFEGVEAFPALQTADAVGYGIEEAMPLLQEVTNFGVAAIEIFPTATDAVAVGVVIDDTFPSPVDLSGIGYAVEEFVGAPVDTVFLTVEIEAGPSAVASNTNWTNPNNVLGEGSTTAPWTNLSVSSSGLLNQNNNTKNGTIVVDLPDFNLGDLALTSVTLVTGAHGAASGLGLQQGTQDVDFDWSVGAGWNTYANIGGNSPNTNEFNTDLSAFVPDQLALNALQIRATGTVTSGVGTTVIQVMRGVNWRYLRLTAVASKQYQD